MCATSLWEQEQVHQATKWVAAYQRLAQIRVWKHQYSQSKEEKYSKNTIPTKHKTSRTKYARYKPKAKGTDARETPDGLDRSQLTRSRWLFIPRKREHVTNIHGWWHRRTMIPTPVGGNSVLSAITKIANGKGNWNNGVFKQLVKCNAIGYQLKQPKQNLQNKKEDHWCLTTKPDDRQAQKNCDIETWDRRTD